MPLPKLPRVKAANSQDSQQVHGVSNFVPTLLGTDKFVFAIIGGLLAVKLLLLVTYGPVFTPDSSGYSSIAETMLSSSAWLRDAGLTQTFPSFGFRMMGYPAILAAAMTVGGSAWPYLVVSLQSAVSLFTAWATVRLGDELNLGRGLSWSAVALSATSLQLTLDQCILTDSLHASFVILAIVLLVRGTRSGRPLAAGHALAAGVLLALAFLLREMMQVLIVLFPLLVVARVAGVEKTLRARTAAAGLLVLLPPLATIEAYKAWNVYRTGERFVTTGAQTAVLFALNQAAKSDADLLAADTPLDRAMRRHFRNHTYEEVLEINATLNRDGHPATDIARMATARYVSAWRDHPSAMLSLLVPPRLVQVTITARPVTAVCDVIAWGGGRARCPQYRDVYGRLVADPLGLTVAEYTGFIVVSIQTLFSILLFAAFTVGVPLCVSAAWRRNAGPLNRTAAGLLAAFWVLYWGWDLAYAAIHFEDRYMAPLVPLSTFGGLYVMAVGRLHLWPPRTSTARQVV